jgi:hypothetical protein
VSPALAAALAAIVLLYLVAAYVARASCRM